LYFTINQKKFGGIYLEIIFERAKLEDGEKLLAIQRKSFQEALELYKDYDTNPMFEKIEKILYKIENHNYYKIIADGIIIGGLNAYKRADFHYYINRIFIHPDFENLGIGKKAIEFIEKEKEFVDARIWTLETPHKSLKNHYFYEKLGYVRNGEVEEINENLKLIYFEKVIRVSH
jgi:GNAT superfamily N-acetyltransferase